MIIGICGQKQSGKDTVAKMMQYYFYHKKRNTGNNIIETSIKKYEDFFAISHLINSYSGWQIRKFASKLKQMAAILLGCKEEDFESEEFKNSLLPDSFQENLNSINDNWIGAIDKTERTVRWLLQTLGSEVGRNINKDIWVNALMADYEIKIVKKGFVTINEYEPKNHEYTKDFPNWIISDVRYLNEAKAIKDRHGIILKIVRGAKTKDTHSSEVELDSIYPDWTIYNDDSIEKLYENVCDFLELKFIQ